jgi:hypothetical protein
MQGKLRTLKTDSQASMILEYLQRGFTLTVEQARGLGFGSNLRSRIPNLHDCGYDVVSEKVKTSTGYIARYFMPEFKKD